MKFTTTVLSAAVLSASAFAAPMPEAQATITTHSQMAANEPEWTITSLKRPCGKLGKQCTWSFGINMNNGSPITPCSFVVKSANPSQTPANETDSTGNICGNYTIGTGWSGQFGPGNGFTTLSVVNNVVKQIIYPAYTDKQLANGTVVTPDQSYAPANLP